MFQRFYTVFYKFINKSFERESSDDPADRRQV